MEIRNQNEMNNNNNKSYKTFIAWNTNQNNGTHKPIHRIETAPISPCTTTLCNLYAILIVTTTKPYRYGSDTENYKPPTKTYKST